SLQAGGSVDRRAAWPQGDGLGGAAVVGQSAEVEVGVGNLRTAAAAVVGEITATVNPDAVLITSVAGAVSHNGVGQPYLRRDVARAGANGSDAAATPCPIAAERAVGHIDGAILGPIDDGSPRA